jgi:hypothetical protein
MFCNACGEQLPEGSAFCHKCGGRVGLQGSVQPNATPSPIRSTPDEPRSQSRRCLRCGATVGEGVLYCYECRTYQEGQPEIASLMVSRGTSPQIVCPHCQVKGNVSTRQVKQKVGVSGAKATGALLTGGLSLLATGLSRKQQVTEARCSNCGSVWHF